MSIDANILTIEKRIFNSISLGESHFREFKSAYEGTPLEKKPRPVRSICKDISEALVAFANADGGELIIGVEDSGEITGIPHDEEKIRKILTTFINYIHGTYLACS